MGCSITRAAYQTLVDQDLKWLLGVPRTLERDHVESIVRNSVNLYYPVLPESFTPAKPKVRPYNGAIEASVGIGRTISRTGNRFYEVLGVSNDMFICGPLLDHQITFEVAAEQCTWSDDGSICGVPEPN